MFELIGLLFATGLLVGVASVLSLILVVVTRLLLRNREAPRKRLTLAAATIPIASAAYLWLCIAMLPGSSLFGDISQPLPNGYSVEALGKMPDFASITNSKTPNSYSGLTECIGKLAVYGPLVVGQYSHPCSSFYAKPAEPFFLFDTRTGKNLDLPTQADLQNKVGNPVNLAEVQFFRSREPAYLSQQRANRAIEFGPPIIALAILIAFVLASRRRPRSHPPNIYT